MPVPTNTTILTAQELGTTFPVIINEPNIELSTGPDHEVWFTFVAPVKCLLVSILAYPDTGTIYQPSVRYYIGPASAPTEILGLAWPNYDQPCTRPTEPGNRYYLQVFNANNVAFTSGLGLEVLVVPNLAIPAGTILINEDQEPTNTDVFGKSRASLLGRLDHKYLGVVPTTAGEEGAMLPSGIFTLDNSDTSSDPDSGCYIYNPQCVQTSFVILSDYIGTANITNDDTKFYYLFASGIDGKLRNFSSDGVLDPTIKTLTAIVPFTMAMKRDSTILYCVVFGSNIVKKYQLSTQTFLADLATGPIGASPIRDSFVLNNGNILVGWALVAALHYSVRLYDPTGALVHEYLITLTAAISELTPRISIGHDDTYFTFWTTRFLSPGFKSRFVVINIADGSVLDDNEVPAIEGNRGIQGTGQQTNMARFGNAKSCPILTLKISIANTASGLYKLTGTNSVNTRVFHDSIWVDPSIGTTQNVAIPDPFAESYLAGDE